MHCVTESGEIAKDGTVFVVVDSKDIDLFIAIFSTKEKANQFIEREKYRGKELISREIIVNYYMH